MADASKIIDLLGGLGRTDKSTTSASRTTATPATALQQAISNLVAVLRDNAGFRATAQQERKLQRIFRSAPAAEVGALVARISANPLSDELAALIEDLTNHETYFFRDRPQLDVIAAKILPRLLREKLARKDRNIRIWSAACATGEEPYTLAMLVTQALLDCGLAYEMAPGEVRIPPEWRVEVIGTDISRQAVRIAREASYQVDGMRSFRQFPASFLRFFEDIDSAPRPMPAPNQAPRYRRVRPSIRRLVRVERANLMDKSPPFRNVDLLLCRNVFIYIEQEKQGGIQSMLASSLRRGGAMVFSPVDTLRCKSMFKECWYDRCLVYEKQ